MGKLVLTNVYATLNAFDVSNHVESVNIEGVRDEIDVTSMGDTAKEIVLGLADVTITIGVFQDYAAGSIDSVLFPLWQTNTPFVVEVRPVNAARSTSNAAYLCTCLLPTFNPIQGSISDAAKTDIVLRNASQAGLTRATA